MFQHDSATKLARFLRGWWGIGFIALLYAALFAANLLIPAAKGSYTFRLWDGCRLALTAAALVAAILYRQRLGRRALLTGLTLAGLTALSYALRSPGAGALLLEGLSVLVCFLGGAALFQELQRNRVPALQPPLAGIARSLGLGIALALPLAAVNNLYFYFTSGSLRFQDPLYSALEALKPGIAEEVVYRYFILAVCFTLLRGDPRRKLVTATALFLAVVPHSLNHLPDLFLQNPLMGLVMLAITSLLFGLPMAWLQVKRNLETSIAFHWLIDFARFWFGF